VNGYLIHIALSGLLYSAIALGIAVEPLNAQVIPEIEHAAQQAANSVAKTQRQNIFIFGHLNCELAAELCTAFESSLRDKLTNMLSGAQFVDREEVVSLCITQGFLTLDVDVPGVLLPAASKTGAEVVVTDTLRWLRDGYEFTTEVIDPRTQKNLDQFQTKIVRAVPDSGGKPLQIKDPNTGVSRLIPKGKAPAHPDCEKCPDPIYTAAARKDNIEGDVLLLISVTEQGTADHISVFKSLPDGLTEQAVEAVRNWRFKPAIGPDGRPVAVRVPVQVKFNLHR
jgi:TonB family protein